MRIGIQAPYAGNFAAVADEIAHLESIGLASATVAEAYSFDAVSQLGYLAARTSRLRLTSGILPLYSRTPALIAMTAAGLDYVSGGRFMLGLGASGPQVIEGFHGVAYDDPVGRTRETIEICRKVWRREPLAHAGKNYAVPLPPGAGTGLGRPMKLINTPLRERVPVLIAGTGPRNVSLAAEIADAWQPIFFHPRKARQVWGNPLAEGGALRQPELGPLEILVNVPVSVTDRPEEARELARPQLALYIGGMGARGRNFYNDLARRYGYEAAAAEIQDLYLAGKRQQAEAAVPAELVEATTLIGPREYLRDRLAEFAEAGVGTINVQTLVESAEERRRCVEMLVDLTA